MDSPNEFKGHTVSLSAQNTVIPKKLHGKTRYSRLFDTLYDAIIVFLEAGSFDLGGSLGDDVTIEAGNLPRLGGTITLDSQFPGANYMVFKYEVIEGESLSTIEISEAGVYSVDMF